MEGFKDAVKRCPSCGKEVVGRLDKKFCSDECRIFYNNAARKRKRMRNQRRVRSIVENTKELDKANAKFLLKMLERISKVFRLLSTFAKTTKQQT